MIGFLTYKHVFTCLNLAGRCDCLLYDLFDRGRIRCIGGATLDVGRRRSSLRPKHFVCRPVAQFCRLRSYGGGLAAQNLATFCRQLHPLTGPSVGKHQSAFPTERDTTNVVPCLTWRYFDTDSVLQDSPTEVSCVSCTKADTSIHQTTTCVATSATWQWIAMALRTVIRHIPVWLLFPNFYYGLDRNIMPSYGFWQIWCNTS
jgi:hypothetical protein